MSARDTFLVQSQAGGTHGVARSSAEGPEPVPEPVRTLMLTIGSSLYIDKLPPADGENENASHTVLFDNLDVFYFGSLVRARMDGVCQPRRQIHVPFPGTTKSKRDYLSIGIRSRPSGARL